MTKTTILASGSYLPGHVVDNRDLASLFPSSRLPMIEQKTGIRSRRHAAADEATSDLAFKAALPCLSQAGIPVADLDVIIVATSSPDRLIPATAARVQQLLGAAQAYAFDLNAVCTGSLYALNVAAGLIDSGRARTVLVIASDTYSRFLNPKDFSTYPYFGDGAGAVLLGQAQSGQAAGFHECILHADGTGFDTIQIAGGGARLPAPLIRNESDAYFSMNGRDVFEFAVKRGSEVLGELLTKSALKPADISAVITHQANINIIDQIAVKTGIPRQKFFVNLDKYGNTAGASILIALDEWLRSGGGASGDQLLLVGFGGGLTWGACRFSF